MRWAGWRLEVSFLGVGGADDINDDDFIYVDSVVPDCVLYYWFDVLVELYQGELICLWIVLS